MSNPVSNLNTKNNILDIVVNLKENINYIKKFELPLSIAQQIDFQLILNSAHIDNFIIASDIQFNSYVFYYLKKYQLSQSLVINYMLEVFCGEFYR